MEMKISHWLFARAKLAFSKASHELLRATDGLEEFAPGSQASSALQLAEFFAQTLPNHAAQPQLLRRELETVAGEFFAMELRSGPALELTLAEGLGLAINSDESRTVVSVGEHRLSLAD
jgi:hypothetical protein